MMRWVTFAAAAAALIGSLATAPARAQGEHVALPKLAWSFAGPFGTFDRAAAQRGFQVYNEVCSACHQLRHAYYRDLTGIGLSAEQVAAIAASKSISDIGDDGAPIERPGLASDHFKSPYANDLAARAAQNGALPPDLSLMVKARDGGADYLYALLTGYSEAPAKMKMGDGMNYNKYFEGSQIAMVPPLSEGRVTYADGTPSSVNQMAKDVVTFLAFISEPETEQRKALGVRIVLFFVLMTGITYAVKRKVWADVDH
ncbi:MAG: cytochrome c1 [Alphaproteobacteria bacterium]|nr:cytochrome c1 [Alphaproteobacteria bacterium]